jgi:hypothetical protein
MTIATNQFAPFTFFVLFPSIYLFAMDNAYGGIGNEVHWSADVLAGLIVPAQKRSLSWFKTAGPANGLTLRRLICVSLCFIMLRTHGWYLIPSSWLNFPLKSPEVEEEMSQQLSLGFIPGSAPAEYHDVVEDS